MAAALARTNRRFTPDEDRRLVAARVAGRSLREIAREIGRGASSVQMRLGTLARREDADD